MKKIITVSGKAGHGKDEFAKRVAVFLEERNNRVFILHFADYLKFVCQKYYGWNGNKDIQGREVLQKVGTDIFRERYPNFWVDVIAMLIQVIGQDFDYIIIPDCRFRNEIEVLGATSVKIIRSNYESKLTEGQKSHVSETSLDDFLFDYVFECETLGDLEKNAYLFSSFSEDRRW